MDPTVVTNELKGVIGHGTRSWDRQSETNPNWWANAQYQGTQDEWCCMHGQRIGNCPGFGPTFCGDGPNDDRFIRVEPEDVDNAVSGLLRLLND